MPRFFFSFSGRTPDRVGAECDTVNEAQSSAVRLLGSYLADHPDYAGEGHWRVEVEDELRRPVLHVIVAAVPARRARAG